MRLLGPYGRDAAIAWQAICRRRRLAGPAHPAGALVAFRLANYYAAVHRWRARRWLRHRDRDVPVGRAPARARLGERWRSADRAGVGDCLAAAAAVDREQALGAQRTERRSVV